MATRSSANAPAPILHPDSEVGQRALRLIREAEIVERLREDPMDQPQDRQLVPADVPLLYLLFLLKPADIDLVSRYIGKHRGFWKVRTDSVRPDSDLMVSPESPLGWSPGFWSFLQSLPRSSQFISAFSKELLSSIAAFVENRRSIKAISGTYLTLLLMGSRRLLALDAVEWIRAWSQADPEEELREAALHADNECGMDFQICLLIQEWAFRFLLYPFQVSPAGKLKLDRMLGLLADAISQDGGRNPEAIPNNGTPRSVWQAISRNISKYPEIVARFLLASRLIDLPKSCELLVARGQLDQKDDCKASAQDQVNECLIAGFLANAPTDYIEHQVQTFAACATDFAARSAGAGFSQIRIKAVATPKKTWLLTIHTAKPAEPIEVSISDKKKFTRIHKLLIAVSHSTKFPGGTAYEVSLPYLLEKFHKDKIKMQKELNDDYKKHPGEKSPNERMEWEKAVKVVNQNLKATIIKQLNRAAEDICKSIPEKLRPSRQDFIRVEKGALLSNIHPESVEISGI